MVSECTKSAEAKRAEAALEMLGKEAEQFSDAAQAALVWMRPQDAERFMRQYEWFVKKTAAPCGGADALQALADAALERWRLEKITEKAVKRMNLLGAEVFLNRYSWFRSRLDAAFGLADMRTVDMTGEIYSVGMAATALNADEFDDEKLCVARMVDPVVMAGDKVLRTGAVMLCPADEE